MTKKSIILLMTLLIGIVLFTTGCSISFPSLPWAQKTTPTTSQSTNTSSGNSTSVASNSPAPTFSINIPDQSTDKTIIIPGIAGKDQKVFINKKETTVDANGNFTATIDLVPGNNQLTIKVFSKDGRSVYSTGKNITYTPHIPKLILTNPLPSSYASENSSINIMGTTDSNSKITANGTNVLPDANGNFIINVPLNSGENIIKVDSTNPSGLVNSVQQVINFTKVDKKPKLVVSLPDSGFISNDKLIINGFTDPNNIIEVYNNYSNSNNTVQSLIFKGSISNDTFSIPVSLSDGSNTLLIRATNEFNVNTELTKTVTYKK